MAATLGWVGTAMTFAAYLLLTRGRLTTDSRRYAGLNVVGGLLGGSAALLYGAWPSVAASFVWAAVALITLVSRLEIRLVMPDRTRSAAPDTDERVPAVAEAW